MWDLLQKFIEVGGPLFGLAVIALLAIVRGDVITRRTYEDMLREKNDQLRRERERVAELWEIVLPSLQVGRGALNRLEQDHPRRAPKQP